ncbi:hemerythrin domain-containing protein [Streptomyces boluensis]|uniref:Hemerythrin domain-containing protein n=1 Tax=Streptomyces boluensis TaxID=1775135 RepID=A0A964XJ07_9ACTN|nr:hemerythrin domain-containing protein [Streptomyces boluensis]NBE50799.1 hemerythrin domain-containing protein [Streptomyces boluensis]
MMPPEDVVELVLDDHRTMEDLLRLMRSVEADRKKALHDFTDLLIAHGEAEHSVLLSALSPHADTGAFVRIEAEHAEAVKVLLALIEVREIGSAEWEWRLQHMATATHRHCDETERNLLNLACTRFSCARRAELAEDFAKARCRMLRAGCGSVDAVRRLLQAGVPA